MMLGSYKTLYMRTGIVLFLLMVSMTAIAEPGKVVHEVSIVQLIANPDAFDGKYVRVIGFLRLEFEGDSLYLHREDYEKGISKNGLWISTNEELQRNAEKYNLVYVLIEGTFNSSFTGHLSGWSGALKTSKGLWFGRSKVSYRHWSRLQNKTHDFRAHRFYRYNLKGEKWFQ